MSKENIVSFSGGKDSSAMLLRMIELGMQVDKVIFADTTLEFPEMYEWIKDIEKLLPCKVTIVKAKHTWDNWFYGKFTKGKYKGRIRGFPFMVSKCWWSRDSKIIPLEREQGKGNIIYIGIAKDEEKRAEVKQYKGGKNKYRFPLIEWDWSEQDCLDYLEKRGLKHPLSKFKRTGCWLCPKQNLKSLKILMMDYPDLWEKLKKYEKDSPHGFKPNFKLKDFEKKALSNSSPPVRTSNSTSLTSDKLKGFNMGLEVSATPSPKSPTATSPNPNIRRNSDTSLAGLVQLKRGKNLYT